jgi:hypothetical protein
MVRSSAGEDIDAACGQLVIRERIGARGRVHTTTAERTETCD